MKKLGYRYSFVEHIQAWIILSFSLPSVLIIYGFISVTDFGKKLGFMPLSLLSIWGIIVVLCTILNAVRVRKEG